MQALLLRQQLREHPRTHEGGFWHKKVYRWQMWLDGLYMGEPFYAMYSQRVHDDTAFNDIANQFIYMENHSRDAATGLMYHGWDESKEQQWANKQTGTSPNFWGRAMGWYGIALVDVLEYYPDDNANKQKLIDILHRFTAAIVKVQDDKTGLWWDVLNFPNRQGNYFEASASCMFVYAIAKGIRLGYLPASYLPAAEKGYKGIIQKFVVKDSTGLVHLDGTVSVSGLGGNPYRDGSYEYYLREKVVRNDLKGVGAFIQMCVEMEMIPTMKTGKGKTVLLDGYFNHERKYDVASNDTIQFHYVWDEDDNNGYSILGRVFNKYGVATKFSAIKPTADVLKKANMYIIVDPDTTKENPNPNYIQQDDINVYIRSVNILYNAPAASCGFKAQAYISTNKSTVVYIDIFGATTHFTANNEATMCMVYYTITHFNISCRHPAFTAFCIAPGFNANTVIAYIKCAAFNQHIAATLHINAIPVLRIPRILYIHISHS